MAILALDGIGHSFGDNWVLKQVSFGIEDHHRIGLIGRNGSGKTTLLEILSGILVPVEGTVHRRKGCSVAYLTQSFQTTKSLPLLDYLISSHHQVFSLKKKIREVELLLSNNSSSENLAMLDRLQSEYLALEGYSIDHKAKTILNQLGFMEQDWDRDVQSFSGGEKTRMQLAATLLKPSSIILLDEPTNHLDLKMRMWLTKYLLDLSAPYLIVSHDRHFLDSTTNTTLSLDGSKLYPFSGNYSFFEKENRLRQQQLLKAYREQEEYIAKTTDFIRRNIAGQKTKQAKSRIKTLDRMDRIEAPEQYQSVTLKIKPVSRSGNIVFSLENLSFGFVGGKNQRNETSIVLGEGINKTVNYLDRIAVLGDNGCGKTTFLQVLIGERKPLCGRLIRGAKISIGYYDQLHLKLDPEVSVFHSISSEHLHWDNYNILSWLARYGFREDDVEKKVSTLSGGEKARLYLALLIAREPNLLIMDEPTNHLDIAMIESLEDALKSFSGTIIFVSHDRRFVNNVANRTWLLKDQKVVETHDWESYLFKVDDSIVKRDKAHQNKEKNRKTNPIVLEKKLQDIENKQGYINCKIEELNALHHKFTQKRVLQDAELVKELRDNIGKIECEIGQMKVELNLMEEEYLSLLD